MQGRRNAEDIVQSFKQLETVNCGHYPMVFIPGISTIKGEPVQDAKENAEDYEEGQEQRRLERKLRSEKLELEVLKAQGADTDAINSQKAKVDKADSDIQKFCDDTGRTRKRRNEFTPVNASWDGADAGPFPYNTPDTRR